MGFEKLARDAIYEDLIIIIARQNIYCVAFRPSLSLVDHYWDMGGYTYTLVHILGYTVFIFIIKI